LVDGTDQTTVDGEGRRERKKRQTRAAIADAAMALFTQRGFDAVTVADVARAADVAEKTVFNHFPAKEDLLFVRGAERRAALVEAVRRREPGVPVIDLFRAATTAFLDDVEHGSVEEIVAVPRLVVASPTLRDRLFVGWEREAALLAPAIAQGTGAAEDDLVVAVVARTLAWTHRIVFREAFTRLLAGEDQRAVAAALRTDAQRAYDQLAAGLEAFGRA
jgi:AcrR family transcriptional regulator